MNELICVFVSLLIKYLYIFIVFICCTFVVLLIAFLSDKKQKKNQENNTVLDQTDRKKTAFSLLGNISSLSGLILTISSILIFIIGTTIFGLTALYNVCYISILLWIFIGVKGMLYSLTGMFLSSFNKNEKTKNNNKNGSCCGIIGTILSALNFFVSCFIALAICLIVTNHIIDR